MTEFQHLRRSRPRTRGLFLHPAALAGTLCLAAATVTAPVRAQERPSEVDAEAEDVAEALGRMDQSYTYRGLRSGHGSAQVAGSSFGDAPDRAAGDGRRTTASGAVILQAPRSE